MDNFKMGDIVQMFDSLNAESNIYVNGSTDFEIRLGCEDGKPFVDFVAKKKTVELALETVKQHDIDYMSMSVLYHRKEEMSNDIQ